ncbi:MAG: DMT family transporter [Moraxellaceae bacterium]|nr:DMT family transporter [Moraxellaceae bacterium]
MTSQQITNAQNDNEKSESLGVLLKILSVVAFATMNGLAKYLDGSIPLPQLVFFRSSIALIPLTIFLLWRHEFPSALKTNNPWGHVKRCVIGTCGMFSAFKVLELLPIAEATALNYLSPIFLVILAMFLLKETVTPRRWIGVACGVGGLLLISLPKFTLFSPEVSGADNSQAILGVGVGVMTAFLIAGAMLQVRQLTKMGEHTGAITFYFTITSTLISAVVMLSQTDNWITPEPWQWLCLIGVGFAGGMAQILMTTAFQYAEASALAPFDYLAIVFAVIIGFVVFAEVPDLMFWLAMPLIIGGAVIAKPRVTRTKK